MQSPLNYHQNFTDWNRARRFAIFIGLMLLGLGLMFWLYWGVAISMTISIILAYLLAPFVSALEIRGLKRYYAVPAIALCILIGMVIAVWFILPPLYYQITQLLSLTPQAIDNFYSTNLPIIQEKINKVPLLREFNLIEFATKQLKGEEMSVKVIAFLSGVWFGTPIILSTIVYVLLVPVLTFALLLEERKMLDHAWSVVPRDLVLPLRVFVDRMNRGFLLLGRGLLTVAFVVGLLYMVGFSLVGLRFAILIGALAGLCRIIPYLDILVGGILCAVAIFADFQGWPQVFMVLGVFAVVFTLDGILITPKIIGESVGLHPLFLLISIIAFGYWWGIGGVLIAIPAVTLARIISRLLLPIYLVSPLYKPRFQEFRE